jgi:hypothetical protein
MRAAVLSHAHGQTDTDGSARSYGTPRDDRFAGRVDYSSSGDEGWKTPKDRSSRSSSLCYSPDRFSDYEYKSARDDQFHSCRSQGLSTFSSARSGRRNSAVSLTHSSRSNDAYSYGDRSERSDISDLEDEDHLYLQYAEGKNEGKYERDAKSSGAADVGQQPFGGFTGQDIEDIFSYTRHGRLEDIERLLDQGVPVDVRDEHGNTLLAIACQNGNKRVAKACLRRGANMNARNMRGNVPLHFCFHFGYGDLLGQYLISKGADTAIRNNAGKPVWDGL